MNYESQYRHDYPPKELYGQYRPMMDSVTLRKTHLKLGDDTLAYSTTTGDQSKEILNKGNIPAALSQEAKDDLRRSHFYLGNFPPEFQTQSQREFYDKSNRNPKDNVDFKGIERKLRQTNYKLGDSQPDYISETRDRFKQPDLSLIKPVEQQKISTAELQKSHYTFGTNPNSWITTQQASYVPKKVVTKPLDLELTKTHFIFGEDKPTLQSVNQETYIKHPIVVNNVNKELASDLRSKI